MNLSAIELIQRHEGLRHFVYKCPAGRYTIGYGRNIDVAGGQGLSTKEAEYLLCNDMDRLNVQLINAIPVFHKLNEVRQAVLINMAYNLGIQGLLTFKRMLIALNHKDYKTASLEMLDSKWAKQVKERANELASIMTAGCFTIES